MAGGAMFLLAAIERYWAEARTTNQLWRSLASSGFNRSQGRRASRVRAAGGEDELVYRGLKLPEEDREEDEVRDVAGQRDEHADGRGDEQAARDALGQVGKAALLVEAVDQAEVGEEDPVDVEEGDEEKADGLVGRPVALPVEGDHRVGGHRVFLIGPRPR